jgi:hypothetical protein
MPLFLWNFVGVMFTVHFWTINPFLSLLTTETTNSSYVLSVKAEQGIWSLSLYTMFAYQHWLIWREFHDNLDIGRTSFVSYQFRGIGVEMNSVGHKITRSSWRRRLNWFRNRKQNNIVLILYLSVEQQIQSIPNLIDQQQFYTDINYHFKCQYVGSLAVSPTSQSSKLDPYWVTW